MKTYKLLLGINIISIFCIQAQVTGPERIIGKYTGDEKKELANGIGKSEGIDTYEGEFKKGLPHGDGVYIFGEDEVIGGTDYEKGDKYEGSFSKGVFEGKGKLIFNDTNKEALEGYWSNGKYLGKTKDGYEVLIKKNIARVECRYDGNFRNDISITDLDDIVEVGNTNIEFDGLSKYTNLPDSKFPLMLHIKGMIKSTGAKAELKVLLERPGTWTITVRNDSAL